MSQGHGRRSIPSARLRKEILERQGHVLRIDASEEQATVGVVRKDGRTTTVTVTPDDLTDARRRGPVFKQQPQALLTAMALHAAADWSAEEDRLDRLRDALAVDAPYCVCAMCLEGKHVPLHTAEPVNIAYLILGKQRNNTGEPVELSVEYVIASNGRLELSKPPYYIEARIFDRDAATYRRYDVKPWWGEFVKNKRGEWWGTR